MIHQGLVTLFRNHPELAFELAQAAGAPLMRGYASYAHGPTEFEDPGRSGVAIYTDVVTLANGCPDSGPVDGVSIEIQGHRDPSKGRTMPISRAGVRSRYGCPAWVLFVSLEPAVRRWVRRHLFRREPELIPLIVEPHMVPPITDVDEARRDIARATLAVAFHARTELGVACALATLQALRDLDLDHGGSYVALIEACLSEDQMKQVEAQLPPIYEDGDLWPMELTSGLYVRGRRKGWTEGRLEQARETLFAILEGRGFRPSTDERARVESCEDLDLLREWAVSAALAHSPAEVFAAS